MENDIIQGYTGIPRGVEGCILGRGRENRDYNIVPHPVILKMMAPFGYRLYYGT